MPLNDIWLNVNKEIGFYTKETFDKIPDVPGVYAWFYPLRVLTEDPYKFIQEVNLILNYDSSVNGKPSKKALVEFQWETIDIDLGINSKKPNLGDCLKIWQKAVESKVKFDQLRRTIMKASIFMPPLYVGKTVHLRKRCLEHIKGKDGANDFNKRYCNFARMNEINSDKVEDLLFVCIGTREETIDESLAGLKDLEKLVEAIMMNLSKPIYSDR
jgi:hypothetical protein